MIKRIPLWWLILLAWLLAISGKDFWTFNVMEAFATFAIIITVVIAFLKWRNQKKRQDRLIQFPNNWSAKYDKDKDVVRFQISVNVLIPCHAYSFDVQVLVGKKHIRTQNVESGAPITMQGQKEGRINLWGEILSSEIPKGITALEFRGYVTLDGEFKKSSNKRKVNITDFTSSESHKEGSQI